MSYVNATVSPAARIKAASGVIAIHALLGAGVIIGLAATGVIPDDYVIIDTFDVPDEIPPAPPPEPVETAEPTSNESVITAPEPPIRIPVDRSVPAEPLRPTIADGVVLDPTPHEIIIPGPIVPPATPLFDPVGPLPRNGPAGWITNVDYPRRGLTRGLEGTSGYRVVVGSDGRVDACQITRSSGHSVLDNAVCRLIESRARFDPAKNNRGNVVVGTYNGQVTWQIPD